MTAEQPTLRFDGPESFRSWIEEHQDSSPGIWLVMAKKGSGQTTVTYAEALDIALAYGWIDGQAKRVDDDTYVQRFTPRRARSPWSARNVKTAEKMIADGRMRARGLAEVERARADGRWERAYAGSKDAELDPEFLSVLAENPDAAAFFETLNSQNRFALYYRIQDAKRPETRARRIAAFVDQLARGEKFYD